jgi:DNA-binding MarR family transcriptional regulator
MIHKHMGAHTNGKSRQSDRDARRVLDSLRRIVRSLRIASRTAERQVGLSAAQLFLLQRLGEVPSASVNELAERTLTHQSSASVVISKLADRGLIHRSRSKVDRRRQDLSLTTAARKLLHKAPPVAQDALVDSLSTMKKSDVKKLADLLASFIAAAGIADLPAEMFEED